MSDSNKLNDPWFIPDADYPLDSPSMGIILTIWIYMALILFIAATVVVVCV